VAAMSATQPRHPSRGRRVAGSTVSRFLGDRDIWAAIDAAHADSKTGDRVLAVAYVSPGMFARLTLGAGDALVVDVSERAVSNGTTDPREVRKYLDAGVNVFTRQGLHAKTYVLGDKLIVGSANASSLSSSGTYIEAGYLSSRSTDVKAARDWILNSLATTPVTANYLERVVKLMPPHPSWGRNAPRRSPHEEHINGRPATDDFDLTIVRLVWDAFTPAEQRTYDRTRSAARRRSGPVAAVSLEQVVWDGVPPAAGRSWLLQLWVPDDSAEPADDDQVYPPARVADAHPVPRTDATLLYVARPANSEPRSWAEVRDVIRASKPRGPIIGVNLRSRTTRDALFDLFSR